MVANYANATGPCNFCLGALRNNNTRMFNQLGPDTGWDSITDSLVASHLHYLDALDRDGLLPCTILYCLNPAQKNEVLGTMIGNFQDGRVFGKMQFGSGWWFNDQRTA